MADLHLALDNRPNPGPHGNVSWMALPPRAPELTEVDYSRLLRGAIRGRLNCWRTSAGEIMTSNSQRQLIEQAQLHVQAREAQKRREEEAAHASERIETNVRGAALVRVAIQTAKRAALAAR